MNPLPIKHLDEYPEVINPKMIAEYLGIGYIKALSLVKSGEIPCLRIGNAYKVSKSGFKDWLEKPGYREFLQTS